MSKPTVEELGIDVGAQSWHRSGGPDGSIEVAFVGMTPGKSTGSQPVSSATAGEWVLMRVAGDPAGRVLVYDRFEWECFLDGVKKGEFDDATELPGLSTEWPGNHAKVTTSDGKNNAHIATYTGRQATGSTRRPGYTGSRPKRPANTSVAWGNARNAWSKVTGWRTTANFVNHNLSMAIVDTGSCQGGNRE